MRRPGPRSSELAAYLAIVDGRSAGRRYPLGGADGAEAAIGRDEACEVSLLDESASRRHAAVARRGERFFLRDLGSRNGTFLNGARLAPESDEGLRSGDEVAVGATRLRFVDEAERARDTAPLPTPPPAAEPFRVERSIRVEGGPEPQAPSAAERRLRSLLALGRLIASADEPRALLSAALRALPESLGADRAIAVTREPGEPLDLARAVVEPPGPVPSRALLERALKGDEALLLSADERAAGAGGDHALLGRESVAREGVRAVVATPMPGGGEKRGVLYVDRLRSGGRFDVADLAFLAEVGRQLGAALAALSRTGEAREESEAWRRLATAPARARPGAPGAGLVGEAESFRAAIQTAERVARSDAPVLLLGETGTGKELFARFVHERSGRAEGPLVPLNCAAVPEALLESELFGHERGAFTGADRRRKGLLELARGGTLFLDEVGEMPAALQAKLLRVLETRQVRRLGGEAEMRVDFRLVAATNRDLALAVKEKRFREDLYYRLAVLSVRLPPLRDRAGDAERLARHFLRELAPRAGKPDLRFSAAALEAIRAGRWPGNVRELRNLVERAIVLARGAEIGAEAFPAADPAAPASQAAAPPQPVPDLPISIEEAEKRAIVAALRHTGGKKGEAARLLGIAHPTLNRKLRDYNLHETFGED